jgi:TldD protein
LRLLPLFGIILSFFSSSQAASVASPGVVLDSLADELARNFTALKQKADPAPYFISYEVTELQSYSVTASLGSIHSNSTSRNRYLDVCVRVGSPKLDNYHRARGERVQFTSGAVISIDDNPNAIRQNVWLETDRVYRAAAERLIKIRTNQQVKVGERDKSDDFSEEAPNTHVEPLANLKFDRKAWAERVRKLSTGFAKHPALLGSGVAVEARADDRYFVNSEGSRIQHGRGFARIIVYASAKAEDGMDLADSQYFDSLSPDTLPTDQELAVAIEKVAASVESLLKAQVTEPIVGPAIFSGRASGVFFHEIFGHRIEGHRQKDDAEGQTFTKSVGEKVLPEFLSVEFDATKRKVGNVDLNGWYEYDDEGIAARPVKLIDNGVLKTFLMSRSPIEGFSHSNGHGRRQPGLEIVSRQSNLLVESSKTVTDARLREMLIEEVKRQGKPYGLYFADITGGFTTTGRSGLQAFKVIPVVVYRVYPDGRPDELIRGADIVGTPLASFSKILATSDKMEVFNGYCGAESGSVPVSAVSPAILISEIEIQKKDKSQERLPLLPRPMDVTGSN